jgi:succinate dehydrogenase / fumarate reductase cytochrome b subunit
MSAIAIETRMHRTVGFYGTAIGKKFLMAISGVVLFAYVLGHMLGNLQIYIPQDPVTGVYQINTYAEFLHSHYVLLWVVRAFLLAAVGLHIITSLQLWFEARSARPIGYHKKDDIPNAITARTMIYGGLAITAFVIFHILNLTTGNVGPQLQEVGQYAPNAYVNVVHSFRVWWISASYIVAIIFLCMHLTHGLWSMLHTVGWDNEHVRPVLERIAFIVAVAIGAGYISIPVSVVTGLIGKGVQ